jgi:hypothetical protein
MSPISASVAIRTNRTATARTAVERVRVSVRVVNESPPCASRPRRSSGQRRPVKGGGGADRTSPRSGRVGELDHGLDDVGARDQDEVVVVGAVDRTSWWSWAAAAATAQLCSGGTTVSAVP